MALTTIPASLSATALTLTTAAQPNITSVGTLTGLTVSGDLTVDTSTLVVDSTNNTVGIGNTSPIAALDVTGTDAVGSLTSLGDTVTRAAAVIRGSTHANGYGLYAGYGNSTTDAQYIQATRASGSTAFPLLINPYGGNVGIGTTSPSAGLHVLADVNPVIKLDRGSANNANANLYYNGTLTGQISAANADFQISAVGSSTPMSFYTNGAERMRIDSSGNVGIGTTPSGVLSSGYVLRLNGGTQTFLAFNNTTHTTQATGGFVIGHDASSSYIIQRENQPLDFYTNNVFSMRILANGTFLVGKTADDNSAGFKTNTSSTYMVASGQTPTFINRLSDNGDLLEFRKDSLLVGSIGSYVGLPYIGKSDVNLLFDPAGPHVIPRGSAGGGRDGAINLGQGTNRFKNLFLSEGVYLGGTGTADKLDDYEEGTWTPTITGNSGASGQSYNIQNGYYTKIGSFVHYTFDVSLTTAGTFSGSYVVIGGLPFAGIGGNLGGTANIGYNTGIGGNLPLGAYISGSNVYLMEQGTSGSDYVLVSENKIGNTGRLIGSLLVYTSN